MVRKLCIIFVVAGFSACSSNPKKSPTVEAGSKQSLPEDTSTIAWKLGLPANLLKTKTGVYSLENGGESLITRAWLCDNAKKTIDIQYYIFAKDNTGKIASEFLVRAADRGVKVRLLIDDITVKEGSRAIYMLDSHDNIEIKVYNPGGRLGRLDERIKKLAKNITRVHRRMHNKTYTVDGVVTITGGRNVADEYFDFDKKYNFRDRDVLLTGVKVLDAVKKSFEDFWNDELSVPYVELVNQSKRRAKDPDRFDKLHEHANDPENFSIAMKEKIKDFSRQFKKAEAAKEFTWVDNVSFVADIPGKNENRENRKGGVCTDSLMALIRNAKQYIDIQSSYLILNDEAKKLFTETVKRGVKVRVLTNSLASIDNYEAFSGYQRDRDAILKTGIEVYEFKPDPAVRFKIMLPEIQSAISYTAILGHHAKSMIIDGHTTVIGSFNIDPRSTDLNTECVAIIRSKQVADHVAKYFNEEFLPENAWRITPDFNPDELAGPWKRIKSASRRVFPKKML